MYTLARYCHWSEDYILCELPLARGLKYFHCALWENGAWTVKKEAPTEEQHSMISSIIDRFKKEEVTEDDEF